MVKKSEWRRFFNRVEERLAEGAIEYGDKSIHRPSPELIEEVKQELLDQAAWSAIQCARLDRLLPLLEEIERRAAE